VANAINILADGNNDTAKQNPDFPALWQKRSRKAGGLERAAVLRLPECNFRLMTARNNRRN
jgi:hypothetical protein